MVQWIRWLENEGGYRWIDPFGSPFFLLIMHFAKPRVYRANRHPGHHTKRRTSTVWYICLKWFWVINWWNRFLDDVIDSRTDTASEGEVWDSYVVLYALIIWNKLGNYKHAEKVQKRTKQRNKTKKEKRALLKKKCHKIKVS